MSQPRCDVLCIGPHTDDAEIALGGTLALLAGRGRQVWVADLTRGELATNASSDERWREAAVASEVMGLAGRCQLALPDGFIDPHDDAQVGAVVWVLRQLRPRWVFVAPEPRRHPDHVATPALIERAGFLSRLGAFQPSAPDVRWWSWEPDPVADEPWACERMAVAALPEQAPSLVFNISTTWDAKVAALNSYGSQFQRDGDRRPTHINDPDFLTSLADRARTWGRRAGVRYGEALVTRVVPVLADLPPEEWA